MTTCPPPLIDSLREARISALHSVHWPLKSSDVKKYGALHVAPRHECLVQPWSPASWARVGVDFGNMTPVCTWTGATRAWHEWNACCGRYLYMTLYMWNEFVNILRSTAYRVPVPVQLLTTVKCCSSTGKIKQDGELFFSNQTRSLQMRRRMHGLCPTADWSTTRFTQNGPVGLYRPVRRSLVQCVSVLATLLQRQEYEDEWRSTFDFVFRCTGVVTGDLRPRPQAILLALRTTYSETTIMINTCLLLSTWVLHAITSVCLFSVEHILAYFVRISWNLGYNFMTLYQLHFPGCAINTTH